MLFFFPKNGIEVHGSAAAREEIFTFKMLQRNIDTKLTQQGNGLLSSFCLFIAEGGGGGIGFY